MKQLTDFLAWLDTFINYEKQRHHDDFSLNSILQMAEVLQNPQNEYQSIHIAGSKGKGSVAAMTAAILTKRGQKTGLYMSPHITDFRERITCSGSLFDDCIYRQSAAAVYAAVNQLIDTNQFSATWFEVATLFAFQTFKTAHCDWAVFETGMGGRLDATNIILPAAAIITPIELEHTEWLGSTIAEIAGEKAGIIKPGIPVFCQKQKQEAFDVIRAKAESMHSPFYYVPDYVENISNDMTPFCTDNKMNTVITWKNVDIFTQPLTCSLRMPGTVQSENAALAALCIKILFPDMADDSIAAGIEAAQLPGRFECIAYGGITIILDGAHTVASIKNTVSVFTALFKHQTAHLLFACAADKRVDEIAHLFSNIFTKITLTRPGMTKASDIDKERKAFVGIAEDVTVEPDYAAAIQNACNAAKKERVPLLICGSFYLVAEVKKMLT